MILNLPDLISFHEAAESADISERYLRHLISSGRGDVPQPLRFQTPIMFRESQFKQWATSWRKRARRVKRKSRVAGAALD